MAPGPDSHALLEEIARLRERIRHLEAGEGAHARLAFERLSAGAPIGLVIVDRELRYVFINDYLARLHGQDASQSIGRSLRDVVGPCADELEPLYRRVLETGESFTAELTLPAPPGSIGNYVASYYPLRDSAGKVTGVCGAIRDVTAAHVADSKLRASEQRYRDLAESLRGIVWTEDADGKIDYANPHALQYCGVT